MAKRQQQELPLRCLADLLSWFEASRAPGVIIGGIAASVLGRPRVTRDVDALVLVNESDWPQFLDTGAKFGFRARISDALAFASEARVLLVRHDPSGIDADLIFGTLPFEREAVKRSRPARLGGLTLPLPRPDDLIVLKAVAHRPRDLADIEGILDANPGLRLQRARRWILEFAEALDRPEIVDDFESVFSAARKKRKR